MRNILVVDDNPTNQKLAVNVLEMEGFRVEKAGDAEEAQRILKQYLPDVILMDIELPGMDGLTLTRLIKSDARTKNVVVIALTAFAMKGDNKKALDAGCDGYISKPIDTRTLPLTISGILDAAKNNTHTH